MAVTKTGVKITVDTSELDIKFTKSVEKLNASLSKSQKALGLFYNDQGLLSNKLGQCVEGLSQQQIKLGQYVDELGNVRTMQGGFTEGLSKTQLALGMYADEVGNVYDITGKLVGQTDKAAKKLEKEAAEAAKKAAQEMEELKRAAQKTANELSEISDKLNIATGQLQALGGNLRAIDGALGTDYFSKLGNIIDILSNAQAAIANVKQLSNSIKTLTNNLSKAKTTAQALNIVLNSLGGRLAVIIAALSAVLYFYPPKEIKELDDEFKKIEERAKKAKDSIEDLYDVLKYGALSAYRTQADEGRELIKQVVELGDAYDKAKEKYEDSKDEILLMTSIGGLLGAASGTSFPIPVVGTVSGATVGAVLGAVGGVANAAYERHNMKAAENDYKNAMAEVNKFVASYVNEAREAAKTEAEKINENIEGYSLILKIQQRQIEEAKKAGASAEELSALQADKNIIIKKILALIDDERKARQTAAGMTPYIEAALEEEKNLPPSIEEFIDLYDKWNGLIKEGVATEEEINLALKKKRQEIAAQLAQDLGVEAPKDDSKYFTGYFEYEAYKLREKLEDGILSAGEFAAQLDELRTQAKEDYLDSSFRDLESRYESGEINASQYADLITGVQKRKAELLLEKLKGVSDASKAENLIFGEATTGRIKSEGFTAALDLYYENLTQRIEEGKDSLKAMRTIKEARKKLLISETQEGELLAKVQSEKAEELRNKYKDVGIHESAAAAKEWKEALEAGVVSQEAYNEELKTARAAIPFIDELGKSDINPLKEYKEEIRKLVDERKRDADAVAQDKSLSHLLRALGDTSAVRDSLGEYNDAIKRIAEAFNNGAIQTEERDKLYNEANGSLIEALQKEKAAVDDATARRKKSLRDSLGVDSYLETLKTPLEKYNETVAKIDEALKEGAINRQEAAAMEGKAGDEYWQQLSKLAETSQKGAEKIEKLELGQSSYRGSESLYLAMVKNSQANFQNRIQNTTGQIANYQRQAVHESQLTNAYLATIAASGALPVFRG